MKKLVLLPTYNECENIEKIVTTILSLPEQFHVLVIDDNSPDGTAQLVKSMQNNFQDRLFLKERTGKLGLGTAYILGFKWSIEHQYDYIFEIDADFSHNPNDLIRLYNTSQQDGYDVVIGSRYVRGGTIKNWPWSRLLYSRGGSLYTQLITQLPIKDTTAGFICYKRKVLEAMNLDKIKFSGYAFQIEMKFASWRLGFKLKEIPIEFVDRVIGVSKMSRNILKEAIIGVLVIQWKYINGSYLKNIRSKRDA
ncbi:MAG: polyprenol monophosphomannose synthase [Phycisphaerales bacterium]|nr:polyprenol monophosphomannose synthase [Phycisphaerales bacterium]